MDLDLGTLLTYAKDMSHKGHGAAAAELKWNLVGQLLSGNTSHSPGALQGPEVKAENTQKAVGRTTQLLPGCPSLGTEKPCCLPYSALQTSAVKWDDSEVQSAQ